MTQAIKRGILTAFNNTTYTASILLMEATSSYLTGVPVATHVDGTSAQVGTLCAVLFFDEQNPTDAVVLAIYPNSGQGVPSPPPGRMTFVNGYRQMQNVTITNGTTSTFTFSGGTSAIPSGALGVFYKCYFTSVSAGAFLQIAPHGATDITAYVSLGNLPAANAYVNENGILPISSSGQVDIKANSGDCVVTLYTYGYIV